MFIEGEAHVMKLSGAMIIRQQGRKDSEAFRFRYGAWVVVAFCANYYGIKLQESPAILCP
jgi:hypothetical protein